MKSVWIEAVSRKLAQGSYLPESVLFQDVKKSLGKLTAKELINLYIVLSTLPMCQCPPNNKENNCG